MSYNSLELDPVGNWRLQDNEATNAIVVDSSSNSLNGTLTNAGNTSGSTTTGTKWFAKALTFDGVNDSVIMPTSSILRPANITVEAWVTCNAYGSYDIIFGYTNGSSYGYRLWMNSSSVFFGINGWNTNNASKASIPADGSWHHIVGTYDGTTCRVYVDGVAGTSAADAGPINYTSMSPPAIGGVSSWSYWDGKISLVTVRNYALTSTQVSERFAGPELENTSLPTLTIDSTSFSGTVGSWSLPAPFAAGSNGTPTYIWELRDADDDSVIASGSTSTISGSGSYSGDYYLWVRASNNGGYDTAEDSVSATQTVSGGPTPLNATVAATLDGVTASSAAVSDISAGVTTQLDGVIAASTAVSPIAAGVTAQLDGVMVASTIGVDSGNAAALTATLDGVTASAATVSTISAGVTATLDGATAISAAIALVSSTVTAQLDGVSVTASASGPTGNAAALTAQLDGVTASSAVTSSISAGLTAQLVGVTAVSAALSLIAAGVTSTLDGVSVVATIGDVVGFKPWFSQANVMVGQ